MPASPQVQYDGVPQVPCPLPFPGKPPRRRLLVPKVSSSAPPISPPPTLKVETLRAFFAGRAQDFLGRSVAVGRDGQFRVHPGCGECATHGRPAVGPGSGPVCAQTRRLPVARAVAHIATLAGTPVREGALARAHIQCHSRRAGAPPGVAGRGHGNQRGPHQHTPPHRRQVSQFSARAECQTHGRRRGNRCVGPLDSACAPRPGMLSASRGPGLVSGLSNSMHCSKPDGGLSLKESGLS